MAFVGGWSVVFGETPAASKWNQLGTDADNLDSRLDTLEAAWTSFSPTWTALTVGNGVVTARYIQMGKTVVYKISLVWGSTTSASGSIRATLPVTGRTLAGSSGVEPIGTFLGYDTSVGALLTGLTILDSTTAMRFYTQTTAAFGNNISRIDITNTSPATWATGDEFHANGRYEAA